MYESVGCTAWVMELGPGMESGEPRVPGPLAGLYDINNEGILKVSG